ncbi:hypothetical protein ABH309_07770 [Chromobacterium piscinae]|uniref:Adhesin n=2 Tax=Chromobacterium piscinae TaxID=686831 RepID=A0ABV0H2R0_9NEIS
MIRSLTLALTLSCLANQASAYGNIGDIPIASDIGKRVCHGDGYSGAYQSVGTARGVMKIFYGGKIVEVVPAHTGEGGQSYLNIFKIRLEWIKGKLPDGTVMRFNQADSQYLNDLDAEDGRILGLDEKVYVSKIYRAGDFRLCDEQ